MEPIQLHIVCISLQGRQVVAMVRVWIFRDLTKKNMLDPIYAINKGDEQQKYPSKTMIRFSKGAPVLVTGDLNGDVYVYRLNCKGVLT